MEDFGTSYQPTYDAAINGGIWISTGADGAGYWETPAVVAPAYVAPATIKTPQIFPILSGGWSAPTGADGAGMTYTPEVLTGWRSGFTPIAGTENTAYTEFDTAGNVTANLIDVPRHDNALNSPVGILAMLAGGAALLFGGGATAAAAGGIEAAAAPASISIWAPEAVAATLETAPVFAGVADIGAAGYGLTAAEVASIGFMPTIAADSFLNGLNLLTMPEYVAPIAGPSLVESAATKAATTTATSAATTSVMETLSTGAATAASTVGGLAKAVIGTALSVLGTGTKPATTTAPKKTTVAPVTQIAGNDLMLWAAAGLAAFAVLG